MGKNNTKSNNNRWFWMVAALLSVAILAGCEKPPPCVDKSKKPLEDCRLAMDKLQSDLKSCKLKVALKKTAVPGEIKVDDPTVTEIDGQKPVKRKPQEGTLSQTQVVSVIKKNIPKLRKCYERSMKKYESLQMSRLKLSIEFKVQPSGRTSGIYIKPSRIPEMTACMKKTIKRWGFPPFTGQAVGVAYPLTLSPRK